MFNVQGSEMIFLLLVALLILGPEKLPDAVRKFTRFYAEFKKMANGFQGEIRSALDEPMRELRDTADLVRDAARFDLSGITGDTATSTATTTTPTTTTPTPTTPATPTPAAAAEPGLNFGNATARADIRPPRVTPAENALTDVVPSEGPAEDPAG